MLPSYLDFIKKTKTSNLPCITSHGWGRLNDLGLWLSNGAISIYHTVIDNQLVELYLLCHREPLYKGEMRLFRAKAFPLLLPFICLSHDGDRAGQVPFLKSLIWHWELTRRAHRRVLTREQLKVSQSTKAVPYAYQTIPTRFAQGSLVSRFRS